MEATIHNLSEWPTECLLLLREHIRSESDLNALAQTNWRMYNLLNLYLYQRTTTRGNVAILPWAIRQANVNTARHILEAGANPNLRSLQHGIVPALHWVLADRHSYRQSAAETEVDDEVLGKYRTLVLLLLEHGADIDGRSSWGRTPLHNAATLPDLEMVRLLVEHGASLTSGDHIGRTPLHLASALGDEEVVEYLLDQGSDANAPDTQFGSTPLHEAASDEWGAEICALLLAHGARLEARNRSQVTPLHTATWTGGLETVRVLVDGGADLEALDGQGLTPLQRAVMHAQDKEKVDYLVEKGANVDVRDGDGRTLVEIARQNDRLWIVECLQLQPAQVENTEKQDPTVEHDGKKV